MINSVIQECRADVICLQETKLEGNSGEEIKQVWGKRGETTRGPGVSTWKLFRG